MIHFKLATLSINQTVKFLTECRWKIP